MTEKPKSSLLTDVVIEDLCGVGNVELHFDPKRRVHVLFGENGVGKTKCLEALYQFLLSKNSICQKYHLHNHNLHPVYNNITGDVTGHDLPVVFLGAGRRANLAKTDQDPNRRHLALEPLGTFEERQNVYFNLLIGAFQSGNLSSLGMSDDTRVWFIKRDKANRPSVKDRDRWTAEIDAVLFMLHEIEPDIDLHWNQIPGGGKLSYGSDSEDNMILRIKGEERKLEELSSGYAALVKMLQAIIAGYSDFTDKTNLQNVQGIVFIDEIDAHLHPEWQAKIVPCLEKLLPNTTFYVATHSPLVLTQLRDGEAYLLKRDANGVVRSKVIDGANRRLFSDPFEHAFGITLNKLQHQAMDRDPEQMQRAKKGLLDLLDEVEAAEAKQ
jgi:predicted ATPase